jgi:diaminohydroxyphosphoribosylaminopyrimidine deaminase/5-amino-6-(5-phosphoribosylamino)uracil reductase
VIVKDGAIIAEGWHKKAGEAHAEINAIESAKVPVAGATMYVTLEPCSHQGRTPPCVDRIIAEKISRVVIAVKDPNPQVDGKSIEKFKKHGIEVRVGVLEDESRKLNEVFFVNQEEERPYVVAKWAMTLDGATADKNGDSKWVTGDDVRKYAKTLRAQYDAVLVGVETVLCDNPKLDVEDKAMVKIVIDSRLRTPANASLFQHAKHVCIICDKDRLKPRRYPANVELIAMHRGRHGFSPKKILEALFRRGVMSVFVEGGGVTTGIFFDDALVDKVYAFTAPVILGTVDARRPVAGKAGRKFKQRLVLSDHRSMTIGDCFLTEGYPVYT